MIQFDLKNRVAIITGGAQGFGFSIAERFIQSGATVIIWDLDEDAAKEAKEKLKSDNLSYQILDVTNSDQIDQNLKVIKNKFNKIDIFINNAGIAGLNTTVAKYPLDEWKKVINLNLNSVFYCCKAIVPIMEKNNPDNFEINVSSELSEYIGHEQIITFDFSGQQLLGKFSSTIDININKEFKLYIDINQLSVFDASTEERI